MKLKNVFLTGLSFVLVAALAVGGTVAYLTSEDSDVNVMTLGNVKIKQHEYQRAVNDDGALKIDTIDERNSYVLEAFEQGKALLPVIVNPSISGWDDTTVRMSQVDSYGGMQVFATPNAQDKFVTVENTGKTDAYVRTIIAIEIGSTDGTLIGKSDRAGEVSDGVQPWVSNNIGAITIGENNYNVVEYVYSGAKLSDGSWRHANGILPAGDTSYPNLAQVYLKSETTNEDCENIDGNNNGTLDIMVLSQAVQTAGFENAKFALDTAFGETNTTNVKTWFGDMYIPDYSIPAAEIDANGNITLEDGETAVLSGTYTDSIAVAGKGTLYLRDLNVDVVEGSALTIAEGAEANLVVENDVTLEGQNGIDVLAGATLDLSGKGGTLTAIGGNGVDSANGGNGIGGAGAIYIHDLKALTAEGYGVAGFGIGGVSTSITIEDTNISYVKGGYVQPNFVNDTSYGKSEPEGGAAIGSMTDGAVITLKNVTIDKAEGGSKAAGIGARYWTGVTIIIEECNIKNVQGGNASAGIGGSRVAGDATNYDAVTINIKDSNITAKGGEFGAGIGSGYDTHCAPNQPVHTIIITGNSVINATGGKYGAGIGTGYHVASLAGNIEDTVTVNAVAGASREKYTEAMDVGFGVINKNSEGKDSTSSFNYKGTIIKVADAPDVIK